jgi:hypothetical protein
MLKNRSKVGMAVGRSVMSIAVLPTLSKREKFQSSQCLWGTLLLSAEGAGGPEFEIGPIAEPADADR